MCCCSGRPTGPSTRGGVVSEAGDMRSVLTGAVKDCATTLV